MFARFANVIPRNTGIQTQRSKRRFPGLPHDLFRHRYGRGDTYDEERVEWNGDDSEKAWSHITGHATTSASSALLATDHIISSSSSPYMNDLIMCTQCEYEPQQHMHTKTKTSPVTVHSVFVIFS